MKRTNVILADDHVRKLKIEAARTGVSMSERLRLLLDEYFAKQKGKQ